MQHKMGASRALLPGTGGALSRGGGNPSGGGDGSNLRGGGGSNPRRGGGGNPGGGSTVPAPFVVAVEANSMLKENMPIVFDGDRSKSDQFL